MQQSKSILSYIPHPVIMLLGIIVLVSILTYVLPAGLFERMEVDGRLRVIPGTYKSIESTPLSIMDIARAFPKGFFDAARVVFIVLISGVMFGVLEKTGMIENTVGTIAHKMGKSNQILIIVLMTYLYGLFGILVGYENNIALVPIAAVMILAIGGDLMLAAGIAVGGITIGFGLSPVNPYTVGIGHEIAELALFSGKGLRSLLCFAALSLLAWYNIRYFRKLQVDANHSLSREVDASGLQLKKPLNSYFISINNWLVMVAFVIGLAVMLFGVFRYHWFINDISAVFIWITVAVAIVGRLKFQEIGETVLKSIAVVAPGAFMVALATTIKVILEDGNISDTIAFHLSEVLKVVPSFASAICMSLSQCIMNILIPSGSGQALATLPIMIPVGELIGLTRQTTILAFQIGDGVTNLFNPALGGLIAMLSLCRISFDKWLRFILPLTGIILIVAWMFLVVAVLLGWS